MFSVYHFQLFTVSDHITAVYSNFIALTFPTA